MKHEISFLNSESYLFFFFTVHLLQETFPVFPVAINHFKTIFPITYKDKCMCVMYACIYVAVWDCPSS